MRGPQVRLGLTAPCLFHINLYKGTVITVTIACSHIYFTQRNVLLNSKQQKKMIGRRTRFQENGDLRPWRGSAAKKKPPFLMHAR